MKFLLRRTSGNYDKLPIKSKEWKVTKENFSATDFAKPFDTEGWFIEINTLEELIKFFNYCNNDLIITQSMYNHKLLELEIYDDYRE